MLTGETPEAAPKLSAPPVEVRLTAPTLVVEIGPVPEYTIVVGAVVLRAAKPGAGAVAVPALAVAVKTVAGPSTQVMLLPVCEQVVACAYALCGNINVNIAVGTLLSNARRTIEFVMKWHPC